MKETSLSRRQLMKLLGMSAAGLALPITLRAQPQKKHLITLSFDDGFKRSSLLTAQLFEKYKLSACITVIATMERFCCRVAGGESAHRRHIKNFDIQIDSCSRGQLKTVHLFPLSHALILATPWCALNKKIL